MLLWDVVSLRLGHKSLWVRRLVRISPARNLRRILYGEVKLLSVFIHSHRIGAMGDAQLAYGLDVSFGIVRKDDDAIPDVVLDGVNVAVFRVDVNAAVELQIG